MMEGGAGVRFCAAASPNALLFSYPYRVLYVILPPFK
jgi:hypothetical protein